ncbi:hypothetical protein EQV77_06325 [Halobacillus fulvus]|nr:hypothetical protein EQV77_06325 [Halobacillus fulvus]
MLHKRLGAIIMFVILLTTGCSVAESQSETESKEENKIEQTAPEKVEENEIALEKKEEEPVLDKQFYPPHFKVTDFAVRIDEQNKLSIRMNYLFDQELFEFLRTEQPEFYYAIEYPEAIHEMLGQPTSDFIRGETFSATGGQLNHSLEIEEQLPEDISENDLGWLRDEWTGYRLILSDQNQDAFHIFDDIFHYSKS